MSSTPDPNLSNNTSSFTSTIQATTAVDVSSFNAYAQPDGTVRLVWHTREESRNLGFHVYREDGLGRHRVDPALIAGSALLLAQDQNHSTLPKLMRRLTLSLLQMQLTGWKMWTSTARGLCMGQSMQNP